MTVIRLYTHEVFQTDSQEYDILFNAAKAIKGTEGAIVEIGTRRGGSAKIIIDALVENTDTDRSMFCIDPYGNIEIECTNLSTTIHNPDRPTQGDKMSKQITSKQRFDYHNSTMRNVVIPSLYYYAYNAGLNFNFFCLEDTEFFARYSDGVPVYDQVKTIQNSYAFVFFDGPHDNESVDKEIEFFITRAPIGAVFVFDDIWMYDHDESVEQKWLFQNGFEILEKKNIKASYKKVR